MPAKERDKAAKLSLVPQSRNSPGLITATSCSIVLSKTKKPTDDEKIKVWSEWSESEMNSEKWDVLSSKGAKGGKGSATLGNLFSDPDGLLELPGNLAGCVEVWKRPNEIVADKQLVIVVEGEENKDIDLYTPNTHLMGNEAMRSIICQVSALWQCRQCICVSTPECDQLPASTWSPWDHIHPHPKGGSAPVYNPGGKYCVRLHWMGCWRKLTVDDQIPLSSRNQLLLPATSNPSELWMTILSKAILKLQATDCGFSMDNTISLLTGWLPRALEVTPSNGMGRSPLWRLLYDALPVWQRGGPPLDPTNSTTTQPANHAPSERGGSGGKDTGSGKAGQRPKTPGFSSHSSMSDVEGTNTRNVLLLAGYRRMPFQRASSAPAEAGAELGLPPECPHPVLLTMARDQELVLPEKKALEPVLQQPYYLGLLDRQRRACDTPIVPTPPPREPRYLQIHSLLQGRQDLSPTEEHRQLVDMNHLESVVEEGNGKKETGAKNKESRTPEELRTPIREEGKELTAKQQSQKKRKKGTTLCNKTENLPWVHWEDFVRVFSGVVAFYRPEGFQYREALEDLSDTMSMSSVAHGLTKGKAATLASSQTILQSPSQILLRQAERNLLFVDSVSPVEFTLSFSSISHWKACERPAREHKRSTSPRKGSTASVLEAVEPESHAPLPRPHLCGTLFVEKYSWRSLTQGQVVCVLKTSSSAAATIKLPGGRHCFRLVATSLHGYRVDVMSNQQFVLTDELTVFDYMRENSKRFIAHGEKATGTIVEILQSFPDVDEIERRLQRLGRFHKAKNVHKQHTEVLYWSVSHSLWELQRSHKIPFSTVSAVRAVLRHFLKVFRDQIEGECHQGDHLVKAAHDLRNQTPLAAWEQRTPTEAETAAVLRLQRAWKRALLIRKTRSLLEGCSQFEEMGRAIATAAEVLAPLCKPWGAAVFTSMFKLDPQLLEKFPFFTDEWSRAFYKDFEGSYKEVPAQGWAVICREVFHFEEAQFAQFQMRLPFTSCRLHVLDNDTGRELPTVLKWAAPHVYSPNKHGYTVVVDGWMGSEPLPSGPFILRLLGSSPRLALRAHQGKASQVEGGREKIGTSLLTKTIREYYKPDRDLTVFGYSLKSQKNALISAHMSTSKSTALIRMEILDHGSSVITAEGCGSCVIPAYLLRGAEPQVLKENSDTPTEDTPSKHMHHKYTLRAVVLKNTWSVAESAWKQLGEETGDKEDSRPSTSSSEKPPSGKGNKGGKASKASNKGKAGLQMVQFDLSKPHWALQVVTAADAAVEVERDSEREDELRSMTQAWEVEQPGRLKKGMESRRKFLESKAVPKETLAKVLNDGGVALPPRDPLDFPHMDTEPYRIRSRSSAPVVLTSEEMEARTLDSQLTIRDYRSRRQEILRSRDQERNSRNQLKSRQLEWAQDLILQVSSQCESLNADRNAIRERALEAKRRAEAEAAAVLLQQQQQQESSGRDSKSKSKSGKGKKK
uniref:Androglobin-like protein n=1 Tax=Halisarca dujardinii TaxID=2583056 RepID=A0A6C0PMZ1_HALDU|nr:Androglobin-like protein [Halisarca dujardinii]QIZ30880.1 androglobin-like protein [Halisarca dujardinii]